MMTTKEKLQYLENRMKCNSFNENIKIEKSDPRVSKKFALVESPEGRKTQMTGYMSLEALEGYIDGVIEAKKYFNN